MVLNYTADNNRRYPSSCDAPLPSSTGCSLFNRVDVQLERTALYFGGVISNNFGSSRTIYTKTRPIGLGGRLPVVLGAARYVIRFRQGTVVIPSV